MKRSVRGIELTTPAGVGQEDSSISVESALGRVVGLSVGENYTRVDLSALLLTITDGSEKPLRSVPATLLLPENYPQGKPYFPLDVPFSVGSTLTVTVDSNTANSAAATPLMLVLHQEVE